MNNFIDKLARKLDTSLESIRLKLSERIKRKDKIVYARYMLEADIVPITAIFNMSRVVNSFHLTESRMFKGSHSNRMSFSFTFALNDKGNEISHLNIASYKATECKVYAVSLRWYLDYDTFGYKTKNERYVTYETTSGQLFGSITGMICMPPWAKGMFEEGLVV